MKFNGVGPIEPSATRGIDAVKLRKYRLDRLKAQLRKANLPAALLQDPINIRYATDTRNMQVFCMRNARRYVFLPVEGPLVLFEFDNCEHIWGGIEVIDEVRSATAWSYFKSGPRLVERAKVWAAEIADLYHRHCGKTGQLAIDVIDPAGVAALAEQGIIVVDADAPVESARAVKSADEIACLTASVEVCEEGFRRMREALQPGISEQELWSHLHTANIVGGGEYLECRVLNSGPRTNPWFQEASERQIQRGELVGCDSDLIGVRGYFADISRTFFCGPGKPTDKQRDLYKLAHEQIHHNMALIKPGMTFRELGERSWPVPEQYRQLRYTLVVHGVGLSGEYPSIAFKDVFDSKGYDGVIEENMTLSCESYIGAVGGGEGVKLEDIVQVTNTGVRRISTFPYEEALLA